MLRAGLEKIYVEVPLRNNTTDAGQGNGLGQTAHLRIDSEPVARVLIPQGPP